MKSSELLLQAAETVISFRRNGSGFGICHAITLTVAASPAQYFRNGLTPLQKKGMCPRNQVVEEIQTRRCNRW